MKENYILSAILTLPSLHKYKLQYSIILWTYEEYSIVKYVGDYLVQTE